MGYRVIPFLKGIGRFCNMSMFSVTGDAKEEDNYSE